mmetsp:Transcript_21164/g.34920  ORF Transcript_21164/g.34920 Transcript_21164/m.34920 type:complete len:298 (+) Transcript_21164:112-1005(+)|eukprot:CAMPEP_0119305236 /NCGR_PEP_ID=MMETSP1333-20130426/6282_1 /TAXON_ID=418940 /ORGANISM="Scyphosphaera apsteinii, Strain RCC1455" /LENGTH=297 /DNA_ID=CAMNT_0007308281 /DNA_START=89 /DNA_END=982 /DNA_ORIENTATION=-
MTRSSDTYIRGHSYKCIGERDTNDGGFTHAKRIKHCIVRGLVITFLLISSLLGLLAAFPYLVAQGDAWAVPVGYKRKSNETQVVRIVLTGGPCAGKSSALTYLKRAAQNKGFDVITAPEIATTMMNSGCAYNRSTPSQVLTFQSAIIALQLQLERSLTDVATSTGRPTIVIFDRGTLDVKGYVDAAMWKTLLDAHRMSEEHMLQRYDGVLHLVTAADGALDFYKRGRVADDSGHPVYRSETPEEAILLDGKMQAAWKSHARHVIIRNGGSFSVKLDETYRAMLSIVREIRLRNSDHM